MTYAAIGKRLGISQQRVQQIERVALAKLRAALTGSRDLTAEQWRWLEDLAAGVDPMGRFAGGGKTPVWSLRVSGLVRLNGRKLTAKGRELLETKGKCS